MTRLSSVQNNTAVVVVYLITGLSPNSSCFLSLVLILAKKKGIIAVKCGNKPQLTY